MFTNNGSNTIADTGGFTDVQPTINQSINRAKKDIINSTITNTANNGIISGIEAGIETAKDEIKEPIKNITDTITNPIKETYVPSSEENAKTNEDFNANGNSNPIEDAKNEKEDYLNRIWEREDKIRKETQEREDNAYQRAVADMRKAGINPNLVGINPANSGGGISNATMPESTLNAEISAYSQQLIAELARELELNENKKDRLANILGKSLSGLFTILAFK